MSGKWVSGDWKAVCYLCGREYYASELRKNWKGQYVCQKDFEPRHPQDFVRPIPDIQAPEWVQLQDLTHFVELCTPNGRTALPDYATPDCVFPDFIDPAFHSESYP